MQSFAFVDGKLVYFFVMFGARFLGYPLTLMFPISSPAVSRHE